MLPEKITGVINKNKLRTISVQNKGKNKNSQLQPKIIGPYKKRVLNQL